MKLQRINIIISYTSMVSLSETNPNIHKDLDYSEVCINEGMTICPDCDYLLTIKTPTL